MKSNRLSLDSICFYILDQELTTYLTYEVYLCGCCSATKYVETDDFFFFEYTLYPCNMLDSLQTLSCLILNPV